MIKNSENLLNFVLQNDLQVFKIADLVPFLEITKVYSYIKTLKKSNKLVKIKNGLYSLKTADDFEVATRIIEPSYISFLSAFNYYGLIDQFPRRITLASTSKVKNSKLLSATMTKRLFFGYELVNGFCMATLEKAILDSLYLPRYSGGIKNIISVIKNSKDIINYPKLISFLKKFNSRVLEKRVAFIFKKLNISVDIPIDLNSGYEFFDPTFKEDLKTKKDFKLLVRGDFYDWA